MEPAHVRERTMHTRVIAEKSRKTAPPLTRLRVNEKDREGQHKKEPGKEQGSDKNRDGTTKGKAT
jgi:hypothetical protein